MLIVLNLNHVIVHFLFQVSLIYHHHPQLSMDLTVVNRQQLHQIVVQLAKEKSHADMEHTQMTQLLNVKVHIMKQDAKVRVHV